MSALTDIAQESLAVNSDTSHPLPVAATWAVGTQWDAQATPNTMYTPFYQMQQVSAGKHLLPSFQMPDSMQVVADWTAHYQPFTDPNMVGLPIIFLGTQIEAYLYLDSQYFTLPYPQNPNAWVSGAAVAKLSPFGSDTYWAEIGTRYATGAMMTQLQAWYPNPPRVVFLLNNEAAKLQWVDAETDQHYLDLYGTGHTDDFKRQVFATAWVARYHAMFNALKNGLANATWKTNVVFYGYGAMGYFGFGYSTSWKNFSLYYPNNIAPETYPWDGDSPAYYMLDSGGDPTTEGNDFNMGGPQASNMNYPFMFQEIYANTSTFWFELSVWNGIHAPLSDSGNYSNRLAAIGQTYTPDRYAGWVQWGMWLLRPRAVRDFRGFNELRTYNQAYFDKVVAAVDRVYTNATLTSFWRNSTLVADTRASPFVADIPTEYTSANRMFMLVTNLDPTGPWDRTTDIPVFALARLKGTTPNRQWLVYAFSPRQDRTNVQITIPNYKTISAGATIRGSFWVVDEASNTVTDVDSPGLQVTSGFQPPPAMLGEVGALTRRSFVVNQPVLVKLKPARGQWGKGRGL